jgi:hypothetical protein
MHLEVHPTINDLRKAYLQGLNIIQLLEDSGSCLERSDIIEIAYDIQSGSYTEAAFADPKRLKEYALELYRHCRPHLCESDLILDCGAGELTTLSALSHHLSNNSSLLACDISLSRLRAGQRFVNQEMKPQLARKLQLFVADMVRLPLASGSIDVVLTVHSLEPNHGRERELISELLRVSRRKLIMFEPCWENASDQVRARMEEHGYVRDLPFHIQMAGGRLISIEPITNSLNPLNPTYCYIVEPKDPPGDCIGSKRGFICPRSGTNLIQQKGYWWSFEGGWAYPEIEGIACLRIKNGLLMSHG